MILPIQISFYRLREAEDALHYVQHAKEALLNRNLTGFHRILNLSKEPEPELNYFMAPCKISFSCLFI